MRYEQFSPVPPLTRTTKGIIIVCVASYFVDFLLTNLGVTFKGLTINEIFGLVPALVQNRGWAWQFVTYIFLHGHPLHLLLNMLILWYFGAEMEQKMGESAFLRYFFICGIGAGIFNFGVNLLFSDYSHLTHPIIGSSGAIFGILAAYGIFFANRYFLVFFLFPMKAKYFVLVMAGMELILGVEGNPRDNVAHFAHLGGMLVGAIYIYLVYMRPRGGKGSQNKKDAEKERLRKQFTLIVNQTDPSTRPKDSGPYWN